MIAPSSLKGKPMSNSRLLIIAPFSIVLSLAALVAVAQQDRRIAMSKQLRSNIQKAEDPDEARKAYDTFFKHKGPAKLPDLIHDSDLGIVCGPRASDSCLDNSNNAKTTAWRPCSKIASA